MVRNIKNLKVTFDTPTPPSTPSTTKLTSPPPPPSPTNSTTKISKHACNPTSADARTLLGDIRARSGPYGPEPYTHDEDECHYCLGGAESRAFCQESWTSYCSICERSIYDRAKKIEMPCCHESAHPECFLAKLEEFYGYAVFWKACECGKVFGADRVGENLELVPGKLIKGCADCGKMVNVVKPLAEAWTERRGRRLTR